jgi:serine/threonine-protein kinase PknK
MVKVCDAVQFAHDHGVVHRDIKPGNILCSPVGEPMIADFGIAQLGIDDTFARQDTSLTPLYAAPEVLNLEGAAPLSDVYSLGATLFTLLQGRPAFSNGERTLAAIHRRVVSEPLPRPAVDIADTVWRALQSAMAKEPELRPDSAGRFGQLLRDAAEEPSSVDAVVTNGRRSVDIDLAAGGHVPVHAARLRRRSARDLWLGSRPR